MRRQEFPVQPLNAPGVTRLAVIAMTDEWRNLRSHTPVEFINKNMHKPQPRKIPRGRVKEPGRMLKSVSLCFTTVFGFKLWLVEWESAGRWTTCKTNRRGESLRGNRSETIRITGGSLDVLWGNQNSWASEKGHTWSTCSQKDYTNKKVT